MLDVAVIGCGFMARYHLEAYRANPATRLVAVCDVVPERASACALEFGGRAYSDVSDLLQQEPTIDLVDVVTPQGLHVEPALRAIEAGKHVFVEKPLAVDLADAERMVDAARQQRVCLATNFNRRFGSGYLRAKHAQDRGQFGGLSYLTLKIAVAQPQPAPADPYFAAFDLLIHAADLARYFGGDVARVSAHMSRPSGSSSMYHNIAVALEFAHGGVGALTISLDSTRLHAIELMELCGPAGHGQVHNVVGGFDFYPHDSDIAQSWRPQPFGGRHHLLQFYPSSVAAHVAALVDALMDGRQPPVSGEDGVAALRIVLAAIHAFETGRATDPLFARPLQRSR